MLEEHVSWVSSVISRFKNFSPLINFQCNRNKVNSLNIEKILIPKSADDLSIGSHYSLIASLLINSQYEDRPQNSQFDFVFFTLNSLGFKPQQPCSINKLILGSVIDHINLCEALEFAFFEKLININLFIDDIRKLPKSFFVLKYYPMHIEEAILIWLSKFPCLVDLEQLNYDNFNFINDIQILGKYVYATLSRVFPTKINRQNVLKQSSEECWNQSRKILNDFGAYIPTTFPLPHNLFMCFICDLFFSTRNNIKKFIKVDLNSHLILSTSSIKSVIFNIDKNTSPLSIHKTSQASNFYMKTSNNFIFKFDPEDSKQNSNDLFSCRKINTGILGNRHADSRHIINNDKKVLNIGNNNNNKFNHLRPKTTPSIKRASHRNTIKRPQSRGDDDDASLLKIFEYMRYGERKEQFIDVENPSIMIQSLIRLLYVSPDHQTFYNFWKMIQNAPQSKNHFHNCKVFITALSGNNNEFAASRKIVYFARQMMKTLSNFSHIIE